MPYKAPTHKPHASLPAPRRPSTKARGYSGTWRRIRLMVLARDPVCRMCDRAPSLHADHIIAHVPGESHDLDNLQGLCASCHAKKGVACDGLFGRPKRPVDPAG